MKVAIIYVTEIIEQKDGEQMKQTLAEGISRLRNK